MANQITKLQPGNHQPMGVDWAGTDVEKVTEEEEDHMAENGTDYVSTTWKKSQRLYTSLIQDESLLKAMEEEEEVEEEEEEEEDVKKSFFDFVSDNPVLMAGIDSSPFLYEMVKSIGYSFLNLEDRLGSQMFSMDTNYDQFAKSVDGVFDSLSKSLGFINETADDIDVNKSAENVEGDNYLEKGGFGESESPDRHQIIGALMKGVEAGNISPTEVIKFETTGALSPHIQKSLGL